LSTIDFEEVVLVHNSGARPDPQQLLVLKAELQQTRAELQKLTGFKEKLGAEKLRHQKNIAELNESLSFIDSENLRTQKETTLLLEKKAAVEKQNGDLITKLKLQYAVAIRKLEEANEKLVEKQRQAIATKTKAAAPKPTPTPTLKTALRKNGTSADTCAFLNKLNKTTDFVPDAGIARFSKLANVYKGLCDESSPMVDLFYRIVVIVNCKAFTRGWRTFFATLATSTTANECDVVQRCHKSHLDRYNRQCGSMNGDNPPERLDLRVSDIENCMGKAPMMSMMNDEKFLKIISVRNPLARLVSAFHTLHYANDFTTKDKRAEFEQWLEKQVVDTSDDDCEAHLSLKNVHTDWHVIPQHCKFGFDSNVNRFRIAQIERPEQLQSMLLAERPDLAKLPAAKPFMEAAPKRLLLHLYEVVNLRWFFGGEKGHALLQQVVAARANEIKILGYEAEIDQMLKMFDVPVKWKLALNEKYWVLESPAAEDLLDLFRE
jgi:hypothetical protein